MGLVGTTARRKWVAGGWVGRGGGRDGTQKPQPSLSVIFLCVESYRICAYAVVGHARRSRRIFVNGNSSTSVCVKAN